jgi:hypothetical protein
MNYFEFTAEIGSKEHELMWNHYIDVPDEITAQLKQSITDKRVLVTLNNFVKIHAALMPRKNGPHFIMVNKEVRKKLQLRPGKTLIVRIEKDTSEYGMIMPEEMDAVFDQDPVGRSFFEALTPGRKRTLIHLVAKIKNPDLRIHKSMVISDHLCKNEGTLDFKQLNEDFKRSDY